MLVLYHYLYPPFLLLCTNSLHATATCMVVGRLSLVKVLFTFDACVIRLFQYSKKDTWEVYFNGLAWRWEKKRAIGKADSGVRCLGAR